MQEKKLVDLFFRQKNLFYEVTFFVLLFFVLFFALLAQHSPLFREKNWSEKNKKMSMDEKVKKILVQLKKNQKNQDFAEKSEIVSTKNQKGRGRLAQAHKQHLLGPTHLQSSASSQSASRFRWSLQHVHLPQKNQKKGKIVAKNPPKKDFSFAANPNARLSVETENSLSQKFWFDESSVMHISVEKKEFAHFFLALSEKLVERFAMYINSNSAVNYHFLRRDSVSSLIKIDRYGQIHLVEIISRAEYQPYLDYVVEQVFDGALPLELSPIKGQIPKELSKGKDIYLVVNFFYTGPPLRKWWIAFEDFEEK